ncbi:MAG: hypothetical protein GY801_11665 [bacterium]|nr:hypothetical protein [bacterium]
MDLRFSNTVRRIIVLAPEQGGWQATTIYQKKCRKNKKGTRILQPLEKAIRKTNKANREALEVYAKRHRKSNRKRKDGWIRDLNYNVYKTAQKRAESLGIPAGS